MSGTGHGIESQAGRYEGIGTKTKTVEIYLLDQGGRNNPKRNVRL